MHLSINDFRYDPYRVPVRMMYRYCKSNLDGTHGATVLIYLASHTHIEAVKREPNSRVLTYVMTDMNWDLFSLDHATSYHLMPDGSLQLQANFWHDRQTQMDYYAIGDLIAAVTVDAYPLHNYNFDLIGLNLIFRHLVNPYTNFSVGITCPDFEKLATFEDIPHGQIEGLLRFGVSDVTYVGNESRHATDCRKYRIQGGLFEEAGFLWVDAAAGHWLDFEHSLPDNPAWDSFKFQYLSHEVINPAVWNRHILAELALAQV